MKDKKETIRRWAYLRQTSIEIATPIYDMANGDYYTMHRIWQNPTDTEQQQILAQAWELANSSIQTLYWRWDNTFEKTTTTTTTGNNNATK